MSSPIEGGRRGGRLWIAVAVAVLVIAAGLFRYWAVGPRSTSRSAAASRGEANVDIYVYDLETGADTRLTDHPRPDVDPVWSPDGDKIAFARFTGEGNDLHDLYVMNADGSGERLLVGGATDDFWPSWSPEGTEIVFMSDRSTFGDIFIVDVETGDLRVKRIARSPTADEFPDWSPLDDRIAYVEERKRADETRIFTVRSDGSDKRVVSVLEGCCGIRQVEWSPDGKELAITWLRHGQADVWRISVADGKKKRVTYGTTGDGFASWSPDGQHLVFMTNRHTPNGDDVYVVDADGSDEREMVRTPWYDGSPDWSPRGDLILFDSIHGADT